MTWWEWYNSPGPAPHVERVHNPYDVSSWGKTPEIKILPKDKPSAGACSRCGGSLDGARQVAAEWNGVRFAYCSVCQVKVENREA